MLGDIMWKKTTLVLLIACILLQQVAASPRRLRDSDESSNSSSSSESSESVEESHRHKRSADDDSSSSSSSSASSSESVEDHKAEFEKLFNVFANKYYDFVKNINDKRKSVAKKFNESKLISRVKIAAVEALREKLSQAIADDAAFINIKNSEDADLISRYFKNSIVAITELGEVILTYNYDNLKEPSAEQVLIQDVLERSDAYKLLEEIHKRFEDFYKSFGKKVRDYVKHLTKTQETNETKIVNWYDEFKAADGFGNKIIKLSEFFSINVAN